MLPLCRMGIPEVDSQYFAKQASRIGRSKWEVTDSYCGFRSIRCSPYFLIALYCDNIIIRERDLPRTVLKLGNSCKEVDSRGSSGTSKEAKTRNSREIGIAPNAHLCLSVRLRWATVRPQPPPQRAPFLFSQYPMKASLAPTTGEALHNISRCSHRARKNCTSKTHCISISW